MTSLPGVPPPPTFVMKKFKHAEKAECVGSEFLYCVLPASWIPWRIALCRVWFLSSWNLFSRLKLVSDLTMPHSQDFYVVTHFLVQYHQ